MGDDGFFSVLGDFNRYLTGKKKGGFNKYDKVVDRTLDEIPDKPQSKGTKAKTMPRKRTYTSRKATGKRKAYTARRLPAKKKKRKLYKKRKTTTKKAAKRVPLTIGTVRLRKIAHRTATDDNCLYVGQGNLGSIHVFIKMIAKATLLHYMHRVGDFRASEENRPVNDDMVGTDPGYRDFVVTWSSMRFQFANTGSRGTDQGYSYNLSSFTSSYRTIDEMATTLGGQMMAQFKAGRRLVNVIVYRGEVPTDANAILNDISAGRNLMQISVQTCLKLQNTTVADHVGADQDGANALSIHRNPIDGYIYHFRNRVPVFKMQYLMSKGNTAEQKLAKLQWLQNDDPSGMMIAPLSDLPAQSEFLHPPTAPSVIFKNTAGKERISIQPGRQKKIYMSEHYEGSINSLIERYIEFDPSASDLFKDGTPPPGGKCVLVGLKATHKSSDTEDLRVEVETETVYTTRMSKAGIMKLPMPTEVS